MTNSEMKEKALGRKLKNALEIFEEDQILFIGSRSAFFFIGTKGEYLEEMGEVSDKRKEALMRQTYDAKRTIIQILQGLQGLEFSEEKFGEIEIIGKQLNKYCSNYRYAKTEFEEFVDYDDRIVNDVYIRDSVEPNDREIVILISGREVGNYWTRNEYLAARRKNKADTTNFNNRNSFNRFQ